MSFLPSHRSPHVVFAVVALWCAAFAGSAGGQAPPAGGSSAPSDPSAQSDRPAPAKPPKPRETMVTPEREAAARSFVSQHHPELVPVLDALRDADPAAYQKAIRELFRTSERLAHLRERDSARCELELASWQAQSRVRLLAARVRMSSSDELRQQLRQALQDQWAARRALLEHERANLQQRLEQLEQDLAKLKKSEREDVEKQLRVLTGQDAAK